MNLQGETIQEVMDLMKKGLISTADLYNYVSTLNPNSIPAHDFQVFMDEAGKYVEKAKVRKAAQTGEVRTSVDGTVVATKEQIQAEKKAAEEAEKRQAEAESAAVEESEEIPVTTEDTAVETYEELPEQEMVIGNIKEQIPTEASEIFYSENIDDSRSVSEVMRSTEKYAITSGMDPAISNTPSRGASISFKLDAASKTYLDHLISEFSNFEGINLEFKRQGTTSDEFFTISVPFDNLSMEEFDQKVKNTFDAITATIQSTRKDIDYEHNMSPGIKKVKDRFSNDDPDITGDFIIGYIKDDGRDTYYVVADNSKEAEEYARSIGFSIRRDNGGGIYEMDTPHSIGTKFEETAVDLSKETDVGKYGVSDLNIYGSLSIDGQISTVTNFIETSGPEEMSQVEILIPSDNPNQRVVNLNSSSSPNQTLVFTDAEKFDKEVIPTIINTFATTNEDCANNMQITEGNNPETATLSIDTESNTNLTISGYSTVEVEQIVEDIKEKTKAREVSLEKSYQKTLGTYPPEEEAAFVSMPVLLVVIVLFALMICLVVFTS